MLTLDQQKYINTLFSNVDKYIEVRLINDNKVEQIFMSYRELLDYEFPMNTNVYIGIFERNRKKGDKNSVTKTNALFLDFDNTDIDTIMYKIDMFQLPQPSMIVNSGHGYHMYWKLEKPAGREIERVLKALQVKLNADPQAVDIARVLRVPDTMNVKSEAVKSTLVTCTDHTTTVNEFEIALNVTAAVADNEVTTIGAVKELLGVKFNGLNNMAAGVKKGERNFCTGRIVQTLRRLNYTKQEVTEIVMQWNKLNTPVKATKEVKHDINVFWYEFTDKNRYRYDGEVFSDDRLEEINSRFINEQTHFFKGNELNTHNYDNELLNQNNFKKMTGLTFATLSIIKLAESKGIRREHIADLCKRHDKDTNLRKSLKTLETLGYIKYFLDNQVKYYVFTEKANFRRGYTAVSKSLHRSFIYKELNENEYKAMILLENYAYDNKNEIYPSNDTLAYRLCCTDRNIRRILRQLEHKQFITTEMKHGKRFIRLIYR